MKKRGKTIICKSDRLQTDNIYGGIDDSKECDIYIGGPYYQDSAQIHLSASDAHLLSLWLPKVLKKLKQQRKPKGDE